MKIHAALFFCWNLLLCLASRRVSQEPLADALHAIAAHCIARDSYNACHEFSKEQLSHCSSMDLNCQCNKVASIHDYCREVCQNTDHISDGLSVFLGTVCSPDQIILKRAVPEPGNALSNSSIDGPKSPKSHAGSEKHAGSNSTATSVDSKSASVASKLPTAVKSESTAVSETPTALTSETLGNTDELKVPESSDGTETDDSGGAELYEDLNIGDPSTADANDFLEGLALKHMFESGQLPEGASSLVEERLKPAVARMKARLHTGLDATRKSIVAFTQNSKSDSDGEDAHGALVGRSSHEYELDESKVYLRLPGSGQRFAIPVPYPPNGYEDSETGDTNDSIGSTRDSTGNTKDSTGSTKESPISSVIISEASSQKSSKQSPEESLERSQAPEIHYFYYEGTPHDLTEYSGWAQEHVLREHGASYDPREPGTEHDVVTMFHDVPITSSALPAAHADPSQAGHNVLLDRVRNRLNINAVLSDKVASTNTTHAAASRSAQITAHNTASTSLPRAAVFVAAFIAVLIL